MLGDPTRFTAGYTGFADDVQQSRLAMVDMSHDRDDWSAGLQILDLVIGILIRLANNGMNLPCPAITLFSFKFKPMLSSELDCNGLINGLIDIGKNPQLH